MLADGGVRTNSDNNEQFLEPCDAEKGKSGTILARFWHSFGTDDLSIQ